LDYNKAVTLKQVENAVLSSGKTVKMLWVLKKFGYIQLFQQALHLMSTLFKISCSMMNINTTFLLSLLASTLFHISMVSGIQYLHFSSAQIQIKSGEISREIDIYIEFAEPQQSSDNSNIARQVNNINENKARPKPKLKLEPEPEPRKETVKPSPLVKKEINHNTQMEKKKKPALLPDEEKVSESVQEDIINKKDLELSTVSEQVKIQSPVNSSEIKQKVVLPTTKKVENIDNTSSVENGITTHTKPEYIKNPPPVYPRLARRLSYTGKVTLKVEVKADGSCGHIEIIRTSGYSMLDKAATNAVKEWQFVPAKKWGKAVSSFTEIVINFQLK
jgi:protein TonB